MGILNVTPDSFFDGGRFNSDRAWLAQAEKMLSEGADIVDVGGFSSRPGCDFVSEDEELRRILPAVIGLKRRFPEVKISVDTFRAKVAKECILAGADIINDISGGNIEPEIWNVIAENQNVMYVLMHGVESLEALHQGECLESVSLPQRRKENAKSAKSKHLIINSLRTLRKIFAPLRLKFLTYETTSCPLEMPVIPNGAERNEESLAPHELVKSFFATKLTLLQNKGIDTQRIILDPGFGFGKTISQNYQLLRNLRTFAEMGPVMAGLSRKTMIWKVLGITPEESLHGTMILNMLALLNGATYLRVHDVKEAVATARLYREYENSGLTNENF